MPRAAANELFAVQRRQRVDAIVFDPAGGCRDAQPTVLRNAWLSDVHAREHLHACDECVTQMRGRSRDFMQHVVNAQPDSPPLFLGFDVKIRCVAACCFEQRIGQEANGRRAIRVDCRRWDVVPR
jgi:hypothetical protein